MCIFAATENTSARHREELINHLRLEYYQPTVLTNCRQETDIMRKEIFGPVLPIATFTDLDQAIEMANDCDYGLTSSIFTKNLDVAMRASNELKFGETYINREHFEAMQGFHAGWRKSGIGGADV